MNVNNKIARTAPTEPEVIDFTQFLEIDVIYKYFNYAVFCGRIIT